MSRLPKYVQKGSGPLTEEDHLECVNQLGSIYNDMENLFNGTDHFLRGRVHSYRGHPCPCVYVFYDQISFDNDQRGLMYCLQDLEDGKGFEIIFRMWRGEIPLYENEWNRLKDDRYKACSAYKWKWRAFKVRNDSERSKGKELILIAKKRFEEVYF